MWSNACGGWKLARPSKIAYAVPVEYLFVILFLLFKMENLVTRFKQGLSPAVVAGGATGAIGLILSFALQGFLTWRAWGDPLPLMLSIQQLIRGNFLYLDRFALIEPPLFYAALGLLAVLLLRQTGRLTADDARTAARLAAIINAGAVALLRTDAIIVAFWYLMSGVLAVFIATTAARLIRPNA